MGFIIDRIRDRQRRVALIGMETRLAGLEVDIERIKRDERDAVFVGFMRNMRAPRLLDVITPERIAHDPYQDALQGSDRPYHHLVQWRDPKHPLHMPEPDRIEHSFDDHEHAPPEPSPWPLTFAVWWIRAKRTFNTLIVSQRWH